jgi:DNA-binding Lrp family transcriptional regulator
VGDWTFITNHARVLLYLAETPGARLREIAVHVGLTERATHRIVSELVADGYLTRHKVGARNFYELHADQPLRLPGRQTLSIGDLLRVLLAYPADRRRPPPGSE